MNENRVLVVEDQPEIVDMLHTVLQESGYQCVTAANVDHAMEVLASLSVDLVLLDVMMPGRSGLSLFDHLRLNNSNVAVVFLSVRSDLRPPAEHMLSGAYDFLEKPVSLSHMCTVIGDTLARRQSLMEAI
jgi:DNA-binding response OmpR family regulator